MSSLVKEDLAKRVFGPRRQRLHEFIEVEGSGAERCYLCAAGTGAARRAWARMGAKVCGGAGPGLTARRDRSGQRLGAGRLQRPARP